MTLRQATKEEYDAMVARLADELDALQAAEAAAAARS